MKILFVCKGNIGRSQMAMEFYNRLHDGDSDSAGTAVDIDKQRIGDRPGAKVVIQGMQELGIDMSDNIANQIEQAMLKLYDQIIVMAQPESIPSWLESSTKFVAWDVEDPKGKPIGEVRPLRDQIKLLVQDLARDK